MDTFSERARRDAGPRRGEDEEPSYRVLGYCTLTCTLYYMRGQIMQSVTFGAANENSGFRSPRGRPVQRWGGACRAARGARCPSSQCLGSSAVSASTPVGSTSRGTALCSLCLPRQRRRRRRHHRCQRQRQCQPQRCPAMASPMGTASVQPLRRAHLTQRLGQAYMYRRVAAARCACLEGRPPWSTSAQSSSRRWSAASPFRRRSCASLPRLRLTRLASQVRHPEYRSCLL